MKNWKQLIGWTLMTFFILGSFSEHQETAGAVVFLAGVVIYWAGRIERAILSK